MASAVASQLVRPQLDFICDRHSRVAACCSKQAGKNFVVSRMLLLECLENPLAQAVYINATYSEGRRIMWEDPKDGLPAVLQALDVPFEANKSTLTVTLGNGSLIRIMGADREAWNRLLGQKYRLIVGDELQKMDPEGLRTALREVIPDRLAMEGGRFVGIGTPGQFEVGPWWEICTGQPDPSGETLWPAFDGHVHHWTAEALCDRTPVWANQLRWKEENRISDDDPAWLRDKLGLWTHDDEVMLHAVERYGATWDGTLPETVLCTDGVTRVPRSRPVEAYGAIDFGFTDSTALVVGGVSREEGILRELHSEKRSGITTKDVADWMRGVQDRTGCRVWYGDNAAAQSIADLNRLYGIDVRPCDKTERTFWHGELESAFRAGEALVRSGSPLHVELKTLVRDPSAYARRSIEPPPGSEDHAYDAWRYLFRAVRTHHVRQPERPLTAGEARLKDISDHKRQLARQMGRPGRRGPGHR